MTQLKHSQRVLIREFLEERRWSGVHSLEVRKGDYSGNPSERFRELVTLDGIPLRKRREKLGKTWGIRVWLERFAPKDSTSIEPSDTELGGDNPPTQAKMAGGTPPVAVELGAEAEVGGGNSARQDAGIDGGQERPLGFATSGQSAHSPVADLSARRPQVAYGWYFDRDTGELLRRPLSAIEFLAGLDEGQLTGARGRAAAA